MGRIAVIGAHPSVVGFALAGALVLEAEDETAVHAAWQALPDDVAVVVLTPAVARVLPDETPSRLAPLRVVLPW